MSVPTKRSFFNFILDTTISEGKLDVPRKYASEYGNRLSSPVTLEAPTGDKWQVRLLEREQKIWLVKGWKEFAEFYRLKPGYVVVFGHDEGNHSHFLVYIMDLSRTEIDYPVRQRNVTGCNQSRRAKKGVQAPIEPKDELVYEADNCLSIAPTMPRFYRIIQGDHSTDKLSIPHKLLSRHGKNMSSQVVLEDQLCGLKWRVGLSDGHDKGWEEFAKHFSLGYGSFLLFEHRGGSEFCVTVFEKSATTVKHPSNALDSDPLDNGQDQDNEPESDSDIGQDQDTESYESIVSISSDESEDDSSDNSYPLEEDIGQDQAYDTNVPIPPTKPKPISKRARTPGTRRSSRVRGSSVQQLQLLQYASKTFNQSRPCRPSKAEEAASASIYPTYKTVLRQFQLSSNLTIPQKFVMDHIKPRVDYPKQQVKKLPSARLLTENGKWSVSLNVYFKYEGQGKLSAGWPKFIRENRLEVGDEILFELLNNDPIVMKVSIFKRNG